MLLSRDSHPLIIAVGPFRYPVTVGCAGVYAYFMPLELRKQARYADRR